VIFRTRKESGRVYVGGVTGNSPCTRGNGSDIVRRAGEKLPSNQGNVAADQRRKYINSRMNGVDNVGTDGVKQNMLAKAHRIWFESSGSTKHINRMI
jgi:hypothetical protein